MLTRRSALQSLALTSCSILSCSSHPDSITLQGSGATFPAPLYQRWFLEYYNLFPHVRTNYQAIGSGAGIRQFTEGLTSFAASDTAMTNKETALASAHRHGSPLLFLPMTAGSIALCANIPGVEPEKIVQLSRYVLVEILLGRITSWNDPEIRRINPGLSFPDIPITWIHRSESSGTTFAFTNHLSAISSQWKLKLGAAKSIDWPTGIGAKGNTGVAALITQTPGGLGYVESVFAVLAKMPMLAVENKSGRYVLPDLAGGKAALYGTRLPADFRAFIPDPSSPFAYPIVTYTWIIALKRYRDERMARVLRHVFDWCLTSGQDFSEELGYVPLPKAVTDPIRAAVETISA